MIPFIIFGVLSFSLSTIAIIIIFVVLFRKQKERRQDLEKKIPYIDYTELIGASDYRPGYRYNYAPIIKFLVTFKTGEKQIVSIPERSPLCQKYIDLLKR